MSRERVTLTGDDAEWFREVRADIAARRNGHEPSNAETARVLMENYDLPDSAGPLG